MYCAIGTSVSSLHRESTDSLIIYTCIYTQHGQCNTCIIMYVSLIIQLLFDQFLTVFTPYSGCSFTVFLINGDHRMHCRTEMVQSVLQ